MAVRDFDAEEMREAARLSGDQARYNAGLIPSDSTHDPEKAESIRREYYLAVYIYNLIDIRMTTRVLSELGYDIPERPLLTPATNVLKQIIHSIQDVHTQQSAERSRWLNE